MKTLSTILLIFSIAASAFGQRMTTHPDSKHGFSVSYPEDWMVAEAMAEATVFKAVKRFPDGQYLMLTVNAQLLDRSGYSMSDFAIADVVSGIAEGYGQDSLTLRDSGRSEVSGHQSVWLLVNKHHALVRPRVEYTVVVIRERCLYIVSASCSEPLYSQYQNLIKQLGDSFTFTTTGISPVNGGTRSQTHGSGNYRLAVTEPGQRPVPAFLRAFGTVWFKCLLTGIVFAVGSALWAGMRRKKNTETSSNCTDADKE